MKSLPLLHVCSRSGWWRLVVFLAANFWPRRGGASFELVSACPVSIWSPPCQMFSSCSPVLILMAFILLVIPDLAPVKVLGIPCFLTLYINNLSWPLMSTLWSCFLFSCYVALLLYCRDLILPFSSPLFYNLAGHLPARFSDLFYVSQKRSHLPAFALAHVSVISRILFSYFGTGRQSTFSSHR